MKTKIYLLITAILILVVGVLSLKSFGYRLAMGYSTGNAFYVCWPILVKNQYREVGHMLGSQYEYHYLPVSSSYAEFACHLTAIE